MRRTASTASSPAPSRVRGFPAFCLLDGAGVGEHLQPRTGGVAGASPPPGSGEPADVAETPLDPPGAPVAARRPRWRRTPARCPLRAAGGPGRAAEVRGSRRRRPCSPGLGRRWRWPGCSGRSWTSWPPAIRGTWSSWALPAWAWSALSPRLLPSAERYAQAQLTRAITRTGTAELFASVTEIRGLRGLEDPAFPGPAGGVAGQVRGEPHPGR